MRWVTYALQFYPVACSGCSRQGTASSFHTTGTWHATAQGPLVVFPTCVANARHSRTCLRS